MTTQPTPINTLIASGCLKTKMAISKAAYLLEFGRLIWDGVGQILGRRLGLQISIYLQGRTGVRTGLTNIGMGHVKMRLRLAIE